MGWIEKMFCELRKVLIDQINLFNCPMPQNIFMVVKECEFENVENEKLK